MHDFLTNAMGHKNLSLATVFSDSDDDDDMSFKKKPAAKVEKDEPASKFMKGGSDDEVTSLFETSRFSRVISSKLLFFPQHIYIDKRKRKFFTQKITLFIG